MFKFSKRNYIKWKSDKVTVVSETSLWKLYYSVFFDNIFGNGFFHMLLD
jgi:hypothetical protein